MKTALDGAGLLHLQDEQSVYGQDTEAMQDNMEGLSSQAVQRQPSDNIHQVLVTKKCE